LLQLTESRNGAADIIKPLSAFRHQARHGFVVTGNDDLLALGNAIE
jgi:hypothetical protein